MLLKKQEKYCLALDDWFASPLGHMVANAFNAQLEPVRAYLRGDTLLQLCNCGDNVWLDSFDYKHKWLVSPIPSDPHAQLVSSLNQIAVDRNALDCVIAPLSLEPYGSDFDLLDEIDRILKPTGFLVLLSINPWSLWGLAMKCGLLKRYDSTSIKMHSAFYINRILTQRGYQQCLLSNFCYIPPVSNQKLIKKMQFLDEVGKMIWPFPSGFYCYIAQKQEYINPLAVTIPIEQLRAKEYKSPLQPATN